MIKGSVVALGAVAALSLGFLSLFGHAVCNEKAAVGGLLACMIITEDTKHNVSRYGVKHTNDLSSLIPLKGENLENVTKGESNGEPVPLDITNSEPVSDGAKPANPTLPPQQQQQEQQQLPFCLTEYFGRNCNQIIELANAIGIARAGGRKLALNPFWSEWYREWFDPREILVLDYNMTEEGRCIKELRAKRVFHHKTFNEPNLEMQSLIPKQSIREQAETIASNEYKGSFVSVHRRNLEGKCQGWVNKALGQTTKNKLGFCFAANDTGTWTLGNSTPQFTCETRYDDFLQEEGYTADTPTIVLFTDGQRPHIDKTFPIIDEHDFTTGLWLMVLSRVHHGVPVSSVDYVVANWRAALGKETKPSFCWS